jgi:hypothetical protein
MLQTIDISLPELLERVRSGEIPLNARACVTFDAAALPNGEGKAALELFAQWAREDAQATPAEIEEDRRIYEEIEKNGIPRIRL